MRMLGTIMGLVFLASAGLMTFIGDVGALQILVIAALGSVFLLFGIGGAGALAKLFPALAK